MLESIKLFFDTLFEESGVLILMFVITGPVFNVFVETIKKQIFPKYTEEEIAAGKKQKECPRWVGMLFGIFLTHAFTALAIGASVTATPHCTLIGGFFFLPVWAVAYYIWQMGCMRVVKMIMRKMFPSFMTGHKPKKPQKTKVIRVPAGTNVEYIENTEEATDD